MPLTDVALRKAKPQDRDYKLTDGFGLYALIRPNGSKLWQMRYRFAHKQRTLSLGPYPEVSLAQARAKRDEAKALLADGRDPSLLKRLDRMNAQAAADDTFAAVADEWLGKIRREGKSPATLEKNRWLLRGWAYPMIGLRPIDDISAPELLALLRRAEGKGRFNTAKRLRGICGQVFRYAIATHRAQRDVSRDLLGALTHVATKHHAALLKPEQIKLLLRDLHAYEGHVTTVMALRMTPLVFARPGELRTAEWSEIEEGEALWRIPAAKMKMRQEHLVPLSRQALDIVHTLRPITGHSRYLFPSTRSIDRPLSENTVNAALRRLGYDRGQQTAHGFRSMASTRLNEMGFKPDWIERQLAHSDPDNIRGIYNAAMWLPQRRKMMQAWADYLDELRLAPPDDVESLIG